MQYNVDGIEKVSTQQGGRRRVMHPRTAWHAALLLLGAAALLLAGCPETPASQSDTTAPEPIAISNSDVEINPSSISLQWEPSPSDDVAEVQITWTPEHGEEQPKTITDGSTSATITGLNPNTEYIFSITAIDTVGNVGNAAEYRVTTAPPTVRFVDAPYFFMGVKNTPGSSIGTVSAIIESSVITDPPVTLSYEIVENNNDDSGLFLINATTGEITIDAATILDTTRADYSFTVQATSSQGVIVTTTVVASPSLDTAAPEPVTEVRATTTPGTTNITLNWINSVSTDAATIRIVWAETDSGTGGGTRDVVHGTTTSTIISGLTSEVGYTFILTVLDDAVDAAGNAEPNESSEMRVMATPDNSAPVAVTALTATPLNNGTEVELSWINSVSTDATALNIAWSSTAVGATSGSTAIPPGTGTSTHIISGLISVTPYAFTITVVDAAGNRSATSPANPDPVTTLTNPIDGDGDGLIDISSLDHLHNMRHNLDGTSYKTSSSDSGITCVTTTATTCRGYELMQNLDFARSSSYANNIINVEWIPTGADPAAATNSGWEPITNFNTSLEGNGYIIANLYVRRAGSVGLFGRINADAIIRSIGILDGSLYGSSGNEDDVGALVAENNGIITASYATGSVNGGGGTNNFVGALVGVNNGAITASYAMGDATGSDNHFDSVGGLAGINAGVITASYATGDVTGGGGTGDSVGALVGYNDNGTIIASYATGSANGGDGISDSVGALVGQSANGVITASYATGSANGGDGGDDSVGALIGDSITNTITASYGFGSSTNGENAGVDGSRDRNSDPRFIVGQGINAVNNFLAPDPKATLGAPAIWNQASSNTQNAWSFGTAMDVQAPALRYADYDGSGATFGCGSASRSTIVIPDRVPDGSGNSVAVACGATLLGGPQPR